MNVSLVLTTVQAPTFDVQTLRVGCEKAGWRFIAVGDRKTPVQDWDNSLMTLQEQRDIAPTLGLQVPTSNYARKMFGYVKARQLGAECIVETDDDNRPYPEFFNEPSLTLNVRHFTTRAPEALASCGSSWYNVYRHFTCENIWPRGFPLDCVLHEVTRPHMHFYGESYPVQNALVDGDPDVDAVYRLTQGRTNITFTTKSNAVSLGKNLWCPFNSQCTWWFPFAYPLMYIPFTCKGRLDDILRSFVAQRVLWSYSFYVAWRSPVMFQVRNAHSLIKDFEEEVPGYLNYTKISAKLGALTFRPEDDIFERQRRCYDVFRDLGLCTSEEWTGLRAWEETFKCTTP